MERSDGRVEAAGEHMEPSKIEAALQSDQTIGEALVLSSTMATGEIQLTAFLVAARGGIIDLSEVAGHLRLVLPASAVPARLVQVDRIPQLPNGMVDQKALWEAEARNELVAEVIHSPRTETERLLAALVESLLGLSQVGLDNSFFDLGGDSLSAIRLSSRIQQAFGVSVPFEEIFEAGDLAALARVIDTSQSSSDSMPTHEVSSVTVAPSFPQEQLWFIDQLLPKCAVYNLFKVFRLQGALDAKAIRQSLDEIVWRHESLRSRFEPEGGRPRLVIDHVGGAELRELDVSELPLEARQNEARRLATEEVRRPFSLDRSPLFRAALIRISDVDHVLVLNAHHIVWDGWSVGVLARELRQVYTALVNGRSLALAKLPVQYSDFTRWQRERMQASTAGEMERYWLDRLSGMPSLLELPTDRARPAMRSFDGRVEVVHLPKRLCEDLKSLARRNDATFFMILLAGFQALLHRYSGSTDIVVGTPVANRQRVVFENLIGLFVNVLPLRTDLSGDPTFNELLRRVRAGTLAAQAHSEVRFERLVELMQPDRSLSYEPLVQVALALQNTPRGDLVLPGIDVSEWIVDAGTSKSDLTVELTEGQQGIQGTVEYSTDLYDRETIVRMFGHYQQLLQDAIEHPDREVSRLRLLSDAEFGLVTSGWNATGFDDAGTDPVHRRFERHAAVTPGALAVADDQDSLTYSELNVRANRLAHRLRAMGVGPERIAAVYVPRSAGLLVAMLGVAKAGGSYLPLDPSYPLERVRFMLEDSGAAVVVVGSGYHGELEGESLSLIHLDDVLAASSDEEDANLKTEVCVNNLAYIFYTSGSTGIPKAVAIEHRGLNNLVNWHCREYGVQARDRGMTVASMTFDASVFETWPLLATGASVHIPGEDLRTDPRRLADWITGNKITVGSMFTSLAELTLSCDRLDGSALRFMLTGGDRLHQGLTAPLCFQLVNHYGPTENSVVTLSDHVSVWREGDAPPPIGRPIANVTAYILDAKMQPVPIGIPGELYVGGAGLARGYMGRPGLTVEKFLPDPFGETGERLYRTGDRTRYLGDGRIEFLGRVDQQVKVRGHRIELGEVETVLGQHAKVREVVVMAPEDSTGGHRLVAYVVPESGGAKEDDGADALHASDLIAHARRYLPEYMIPAKYIWLDSLPLTASGKVNRMALPAPDSRDDACDSQYCEPRNATERGIAEVWEEVLNRDRISANDNFFAIGGHSLLATQVVSRLRDRFGVDVLLRGLFEHPTVAGLALLVTERLQQSMDGGGIAASDRVKLFI